MINKKAIKVCKINFRKFGIHLHRRWKETTTQVKFHCDFCALTHTRAHKRKMRKRKAETEDKLNGFSCHHKKS